MSDLLECCNCGKEVLGDKNTDLDKNGIFICSKECQDILSIGGNLKKSKDWNGDGNSIFTTLGASSHAKGEREQDDFYATDPNTIIDLVQNVDFLENCDETKPMYVWEPACGQGHLSKELKKHGFLVHSTDLVDRGFGIPNENFLNNTRIFDGHIITNPPYKYAKEFVEKAIESVTEGKKVCMFLKLQFLEGQARKKFFEIYPPKIIYIYSKRQICAKNAEFYHDNGKMIGSAVAYCWFVWEKGFQGDPIIKWI